MMTLKDFNAGDKVEYVGLEATVLTVLKNGVRIEYWSGNSFHSAKLRRERVAARYLKLIRRAI